MKRLITLFFVVFGITAYCQSGLPDAPIFLSASVVPESSPTTVIINWRSSDSIDVAGYIVYKIIDNITTTLDSVYGRETTTYQYQASQANSGSERYRLASFDQERFKSQITDPHSTIFLQSSFDKCARTVQLSWSKYVGWSNLTGYKIYRKLEGDTYVQIGTVGADVNTFTDNALRINSSFVYYVEATNQDGNTASSNSIKILTQVPGTPAILEAEYATVDSDNHIAVCFLTDTTTEIKSFEIQRSTSRDANFKPITTIDYEHQTKVCYVDTDAIDPTQTKYYYRIATYDQCSNISKYSGICSNIVLNIENIDVTQHAMTWTPYEEWDNGVYSYKIFSVFDGDTAEVASNNPGDLDYSNDIANYVKQTHYKGEYVTNTFCYFVQAVENNLNSENPLTSNSNLACVYEHPIVWLPNAFNATSTKAENRIFKPVISFAQQYAYEFIIYDRWGRVIFKTTDPSQGWDGKKKGKYYPDDQYIYLLKYRDYQGTDYRKSGTFILITE